MELRSSYKQTEVGIIPEDWKVTKVDELGLITTGSKNTQDSVPDGLYPFFVRSQEVERINSCGYDKEAILTAGDGGAGKIFHYINGKFDVHQRVYIISDFREAINGKYFFWQFSYLFYKRVMSMTAKSSVDSVRRNMIADMSIPVPPIAEQQAIAQALDDVDALVASLKKLINKKSSLQMAQARFLLHDCVRHADRTVFRKKLKLGDVFKVHHGKSQKDVEDPYGTIPIFGSGGVVGYSEQALYDKPSVLIGRKGTIDRPAFVDTPFWAIDTMFFTEIDKQFNPKFIYYLLNQVDWKKYNEASGLPSLRSKTIEDIDILIPELKIQNEMTRYLDASSLEIVRLDQELSKAEKIKMGMMQELLAGRTRLI